MPDLRSEVKGRMEEGSLTLASLHRATGKSIATFSQWLAGKYEGDNAKISEIVSGVLERERERLKAPKKVIKFTMISAAEKVLEVARICHLDQEIGVIYSEAGRGKTFAAMEYARKNSDTILIQCNPSITTKALLCELHRRVGYDGKGSLNLLFEDVVGRLKGSGRLIIIDEAEALPAPRALEMIRRIHDFTSIGVVLIGLPRLISNLRGRKGELFQLYSRISLAAKLEGLREEDTQRIVASVLPSSDGIWKSFHEESYGNARRLSKLLQRSVRVAGINEMRMTPEIIRASAGMLII